MKKILAVLLTLLLLVTAMPVLAAAEQADDPPELLAMQTPYGVRQVVTSLFATFAILDNGSLWAWGWSHRLGIGPTDRLIYDTPVQVGTDTNWASIALGEGHTVATRTDGSLWAWGANSAGQLGDGTRTPRLSPMRIGTDTNWASVAAGQDFTMAIRTDGSLWGWGLNRFGPQWEWTGTEWIRVDNMITPTQIGIDRNWASVSTTHRHIVAIRTDGSLWAWGGNSGGQLGDGTTDLRDTPVRIGTDTNWASVSAGWFHTVAIRTDGSLWTWGHNSRSALGDGTNINRLTPVRISTDTNWASVSAGEDHTMAIRADGSLWAWGGCVRSRVVTGNSFPRTMPVRVGTDNWTSVSAGSMESMAIRTDGSLWEFFGVAGSIRDAGFYDMEEQVLIIQPTGQTPPPPPPPPTGFPFTDVASTAWYRNAVQHVYDSNIMRGTSDTAFSPNATLTRAMVATILHRMAGEPRTSFRSIFDDVRGNTWYGASVTWGHDSNIMRGVSNTRFAPQDSLTREQLAAMMHRFAVSRGYSVSVPPHVTAPAGTGPWAEEYVRWAVHNGFIPAANPAVFAVRAETAHFVYQFDSRFERLG